MNMKKSKMIENVIYYWQDMDRIIGAMRIRMRGIDEVFGYGFIIEDSPLLKYEMHKRGKDVSDRDFSVINRKRAISQVKIQLANVWNALNVHGKKILDSAGNIDVELYNLHENNIRIQRGIIVDTNVTHPFKALKDFKTKEISIAEASALNLT